MRVTDHLWQSRFGSVVMDEEHLMHAVRYVSLNPVREKLVERAEDWPWSSVVAHLDSKDDGFVNVSPVLERYGNFSTFLGQEESESYKRLRQSETTDRPLGSLGWMTKLETLTGRQLKPKNVAQNQNKILSEFSKLLP